MGGDPPNWETLSSGRTSSAAPARQGGDRCAKDPTVRERAPTRLALGRNDCRTFARALAVELLDGEEEAGEREEHGSRFIKLVLSRF